MHPPRWLPAIVSIGSSTGRIQCIDSLIDILILDMYIWVIVTGRSWQGMQQFFVVQPTVCRVFKHCSVTTEQGGMGCVCVCWLNVIAFPVLAWWRVNSGFMLAASDTKTLRIAWKGWRGLGLSSYTLLSLPQPSSGCIQWVYLMKCLPSKLSVCLQQLQSSGASESDTHLPGYEMTVPWWRMTLLKRIPSVRTDLMPHALQSQKQPGVENAISDSILPCVKKMSSPDRASLIELKLIILSAFPRGFVSWYRILLPC